MIKGTLTALGLILTFAQPLAAQDGEGATLADMRAELATVQQGLLSLRTELVASGAQGFQAAGGDSAIDRMNDMENQLARLTDRIEQTPAATLLEERISIPITTKLMILGRATVKGLSMSVYGKKQQA